MVKVRVIVHYYECGCIWEHVPGIDETSQVHETQACDKHQYPGKETKQYTGSGFALSVWDASKEKIIIEERELTLDGT